MFTSGPSKPISLKTFIIFASMPRFCFLTCTYSYTYVCLLHDRIHQYLFVLSWTRVRRVRRGSISSELLMCDGAVRSILLLRLVARWLDTIDVCICHMFVFMAVVVTVWGSVGIFVVLRPLLNIVFVFSLGALKYGVCL